MRVVDWLRTIMVAPGDPMPARVDLAVTDADADRDETVCDCAAESP